MAKKTPHQIAFDDKGDLRPEFKEKVKAFLARIERACATPEGAAALVNRRTRRTAASLAGEIITDPEKRAEAIEKARGVYDDLTGADKPKGWLQRAAQWALGAGPTEETRSIHSPRRRTGRR